MRLGEIKQIVVAAAQGFAADNVLRRGAALSYYAVFSLAPLLIIVVTVASWLLDSGQTRTFLLDQIGELAGPQTAEAVAIMMDRSDWRKTGPIATFVALGTMIFGASVVMAELKDTLDDIVGRPERPTIRPAWHTMVAVRVRALSMVLVITLLLLVSMVLSAVLTAVQNWWHADAQIWSRLLEIVNTILSIALATGLYWFTYRWFPARRLDSHACAVGALTAAVLFTIGKYLIGLYIGIAGVGSAFGAAASLAVIMVWVYYTTQIVLFGAELAKSIDARRRATLQAGSAVQSMPS